MREMRSWSSIWSCTTLSSFSLRLSSIASSFSAWGIVRGNPSSTNLDVSASERAQPQRRKRNQPHPFLQALLFSNWSLIIPTRISSSKSAPASMTFLACRPSSVFWAICSRSMSPVARWQTQNSSRIRGACVPLPASSSRSETSGASALRGPCNVERRVARTGAGRTDEDGAELLCWRLGLHGVLCSVLERVNLFVQLRNKTLEVLELVGGCHCVRGRRVGGEGTTSLDTWKREHLRIVRQRCGVKAEMVGPRRFGRVWSRVLSKIKPPLISPVVIDHRPVDTVQDNLIGQSDSA